MAPQWAALALPANHPQLAVAHRTLLALRGGATVGPLKIGPIGLDFFIDPRRCVYLNAIAGVMYSLSLIGFDPSLPDPTQKYWQQKQTPTTKAILQYMALTLLWINGFMIYAMSMLNAPATGLLKFQCFGWISVLALLVFQVNTYGFHTQQDTLGIMITLLVLSTYLGFAP